ncbi:hypothetical protein IJL65_00025 [bacterium]|nr:hypothetical protein [bacterium]
MKVNRNQQPLAEIEFNSLSPLELWEKLGLTQPRVEKKSTGEIFLPPSFQDEESKMAFEAFRKDCDMIQEEEPETIHISSEKGSLFIWALLKEESKRSKKSKKLSSVNHLFKEDVFQSIIRKGRCTKVDFDEMNFDEISDYLEERHLIKTSTAAIRITRNFATLFHEKYGAWLVF